MAILSLCPDCGATIRFDRAGFTPQWVACPSCASEHEPQQTLCVVCETPNPWKRRDSLRFWCLVCGHTQTWLGLDAVTAATS